MDAVFLLQDDETLRSLPVKEYVAEDRLQQLLARYPDLLAGGQMNEREPRRWMLVAREQGIPDAETE